jgi:hypothetical protein
MVVRILPGSSRIILPAQIDELSFKLARRDIELVHKETSLRRKFRVRLSSEITSGVISQYLQDVRIQFRT